MYPINICVYTDRIYLKKIRLSVHLLNRFTLKKKNKRVMKNHFAFALIASAFVAKASSEEQPKMRRVSKEAPCRITPDVIPEPFVR